MPSCCDQSGEPCVKDKKKQTIIRWVILGVTTLSFIFVAVATFGCEFIVFEDSDGDKIHYGFFSARGSGGGCAAYSQDYSEELSKDPAIAAGRAFAALCFIVMILSLMALAAVQFFLTTGQRTVWLVLRIAFCVALLFNLLMFSVFGEDSCVDTKDFSFIDCIPGSSSILSSLNIFILIPIITMIFMVPPPSHPFFIRYSEAGKTSPKIVEVSKEGGDQGEKDDTHNSNNNVPIEQAYLDDTSVISPMGGGGATTHSGDTVTETTEIDEDGQIKTTRITTNPDGSQTIVTTVQQVDDVVE